MKMHGAECATYFIECLFSVRVSSACDMYILYKDLIPYCDSPFKEKKKSISEILNMTHMRTKTVKDLHEFYKCIRF